MDLLSNEIIFLKYMNNKKLNITFSPRWEFQYNLNPTLELAKLVKLEYLTYSNWKENLQNATIEELKEILKKEGLQVTGTKQRLIEMVLGNIDIDLLEKTFDKKKYVLTVKGKQILEKNKRLFMTDREKAGKEFKELTDKEYNQLQVFHKVSEYKRLKHNELSFEKGYTKNDILWGIYNQQKEIYIQKRDYAMASVVFNSMYEILHSENKYKKALDYLICCLYLKVFEILQYKNEFEHEGLYERHLKKFKKDLKDILKKNSINIEKFESRYKFITEDIKISIQMYLPHLYEEEKINIFQEKINEFL